MKAQITYTLLLFLIWAAPASARPLWLVDFVYMAEGQDLTAHDKFASNTEVIAERYGIRRLLSFDRVAGFAHPGPIAPDRIDFWSIPDRAAFDAWVNDPDRVWYEDLAGNIMDGQSSRYLARELAISPVRPERHYLIDVLQFRDDIDIAAFNAYANDLARIGQRHLLRASGTFGEVEHLSGPFGTVNWLHLYYVPGLEALDKLLADDRYRKIEARRGELFEFGGSTRQLYRTMSHFQP